MTPEERILAMRERVAVREREREARAALQLRRAALVGELYEKLKTALDDLGRLPVKPHGCVSVDGGWLSFEDKVSYVGLRRLALVEESVVYLDLIRFEIEADQEAVAAFIRHDGDIITLDVAVDLAIAVVEANLDA